MTWPARVVFVLVVATAPLLGGCVGGHVPSPAPNPSPAASP